MEDIDRAISAKEEAVALVLANKHPDRARYLSNLGIALCSRFERTGSMEDLDHVIMTLELALELTHQNQCEYPIYLNNLGTALRSRFERTVVEIDWQRP